MGAIVLRWISLERWHWNLQRNAEVVPPRVEPTPKPEPTPPKPKVIAGKLETARLFNGITVHSTLEPTPGRVASAERLDPLSYVLDLKLEVRAPVPNQT